MSDNQRMRLARRARSERGESASFMVLVGGLVIAAIAGASTLGGGIISLAQQVGGDSNPSAVPVPGPDQGCLHSRVCPEVDVDDDAADEPELEVCVWTWFCWSWPEVPEPDGDDGTEEDTSAADRAALEEYEPAELAHELEVARFDGDADEVARLTNLLLDGIQDMSQDQADEYLSYLLREDALIALAIYDGDLTHPSVIGLLGRIGFLTEAGGSLWGGHGVYDLLDELIDDFDPETGHAVNITAEMLDHVFDNVLDQPGAIELLVDVVRDGDTYGEPAQQLSDAVFDYFIENPDLLLAEVSVARAGNSDDLQNLLEAMHAGKTDAELTTLVDTVIADQATQFDSLLDPDLNNFAWKIGQLQFQLSQVGAGGSSYDATGILIAAGKSIAKRTPAAPLIEVYGLVETALAGYQSSDGYNNDIEDSQSRDFLLTAMATVAVVNPDLAPQIQSVLENASDGTQSLDDWVRESDALFLEVERVAHEIEDGHDSAS